jgi:hypothetical protein
VLLRWTRRNYLFGWPLAWIWIGVATLQEPICTSRPESRISIPSGTMISVPIHILACKLSTICSSRRKTTSASVSVARSLPGMRMSIIAYSLV